MSIKVMTWVFDNSPMTNSNRLVLLALADHADDETWSCYPSIARLARKARLSESTTRRALQCLERAGAISVKVHGGESRREDRRTNRYTILQKHGVSDCNPVTTYGVSNHDLRGVKSGVYGVSTVTPKPSLETSIEPSVDLPEETTRKVIKELALQAQDTAIKEGVSITSKAAHLKACEERIAEAYSHRVQALSDANPEMAWTDLVVLVGGNDPLDPTGERAKARKAEELAQREATLLAQHAEAEEADKQRLAEQEAFYVSLAKKTPQELRRARRLVK
jgi:hypothetical protein